MAGLRCYLFILAGSLAVLPSALVAQTTAPAGGNTIVEIRVQGNQQLSERSVLSRIRIRVGQPYDAELVKQDVNLLLQSRRFDSVTTIAQQCRAAE